MQTSWSALIASGSPGEETPEKALAKFFAEGIPAATGFTLPSGQPELTSRSTSNATFEWKDEDGETVATVHAVNEGTGWLVNAGASCAS